MTVKRANMDREGMRVPARLSTTPEMSSSPGAPAVTTMLAAAAATVAKSLSGHRAPPAILTIFGAGGDLTKRLVVPALYNLVRAGKLSDDFAIIGVDHNEETTEEWRQSPTEMMQASTLGGHEQQVASIDEKAWSWLTRRMHYMRGDFMQA